MNFRCSPCILAVLFAVLVTLSETVAMSDPHDWQEHKTYNHDKHFFTKKCECRIETWEGHILHEFGIIETYSFPETSCHEIHQKCRHACGEKLDLEGPIEGYQRGYHYCDAYGKPTPPGGVTLVAVWKPKYCPHHAEEDSSKEVQLCCGRTTIGKQDHTNIGPFGWNKDCKAQTYVVGN